MQTRIHLLEKTFQGETGKLKTELQVYMYFYSNKMISELCVVCNDLNVNNGRTYLISYLLFMY